MNNFLYFAGNEQIFKTALRSKGILLQNHYNIAGLQKAFHNLLLSYFKKGICRISAKAGLCLILLTAASGNMVQAQNVNGNDDEISATISVSATVQATTGVEVEMVTLRDMTLDRQVTQQNLVAVNPVNDSQSGKMRAEGRPNAEVRISFLQQRELTRIGGNETLTFYYRVAGNDMDDQPSSEILDLENRDFELNEDGEYYFWIGGQVDITDAVAGAYDGEFTVEIEYL